MMKRISCNWEYVQRNFLRRKRNKYSKPTHEHTVNPHSHTNTHKRKQKLEHKNAFRVHWNPEECFATFHTPIHNQNEEKIYSKTHLLNWGKLFNYPNDEPWWDEVTQETKQWRIVECPIFQLVFPLEEMHDERTAIAWIQRKTG